jgi:hypothetical protein
MPRSEERGRTARRAFSSEGALCGSTGFFTLKEDSGLDFPAWKLSESDLNFLVESASPHVADKPRLKQVLREDEDFRDSFVANEGVFLKVMDDEEILLKISSLLFFEILLTRAVTELARVSFTLEKTSTMRVPVFDTKAVVDLLTDRRVIRYLAHMLSSFTKSESYTFSFRVNKGIWRKVRFSDMDIQSLLNASKAVNEEHRLGLYKRIADVCLFILGVFPSYVESQYRYPQSRDPRPAIRGKARISPEEYEKEGQKFYKLAAEHPSADQLNLSGVFWALHEHFVEAKKPLNFISEHYLPFKKQKLFGY